MPRYHHICKKLLLSPCTTFHHRGNKIRSCEGTNQGDSIAMAVYAIAIIPMILMIAVLLAKLMIQQKLQPTLENYSLK